VSFDVIDLRSIFPYDWQTMSASVCYGPVGLLIVNEDTEVTNSASICCDPRSIDEHFYDLLVRPRVLLGRQCARIGLNQVYERNSVPQAGRRSRPR